jgi:hypothetical protein
MKSRKVVTFRKRPPAPAQDESDKRVPVGERHNELIRTVAGFRNAGLTRDAALSGAQAFLDHDVSEGEREIPESEGERAVDWAYDRKRHYKRSHTGAAEALVDLFGENVRYCSTIGKSGTWFVCRS